MLKSLIKSSVSRSVLKNFGGAVVNAPVRLFSTSANPSEKPSNSDSATASDASRDKVSAQANLAPGAQVGATGPTAADVEFFKNLNANAQQVKQTVGAQFESAMNDPFGIQKNWFHSLYKQLKLLKSTDASVLSNQDSDDLFKRVEVEFELLYQKYLKDCSYDSNSQRGILLCCLAVATQKVLSTAIADDNIIREIIRINLGGTAMSIMRVVQKFRLFLLFRLFMQDPFKVVARTIPMLKDDFSSVVQGDVNVTDREAVWTIHNCAYSKILANEDCLDLHGEFCCHFSHKWLELFEPYGFEVTQDKCFKWDDGCCQIRVAKAPKK